MKKMSMQISDSASGSYAFSQGASALSLKSGLSGSLLIGGLTTAAVLCAATWLVIKTSDDEPSHGDPLISRSHVASTTLPSFVEVDRVETSGVVDDTTEEEEAPGGDSSEGVALSGFVRDDSGRGLSGVEVIVSPAPGKYPPLERTLTDDRGYYAFDGLPVYRPFSFDRLSRSEVTQDEGQVDGESSDEADDESARGSLESVLSQMTSVDWTEETRSLSDRGFSSNRIRAGDSPGGLRFGALGDSSTS